MDTQPLLDGPRDGAPPDRSGSFVCTKQPVPDQDSVYTKLGSPFSRLIDLCTLITGHWLSVLPLRLHREKVYLQVVVHACRWAADEIPVPLSCETCMSWRALDRHFLLLLDFLFCFFPLVYRSTAAYRQTDPMPPSPDSRLR